MKVYVNYNDGRWKKYRIDFEHIANLAVKPKYANAEVSITLTNDDEIHQLNKLYRGIDKPTNVLSFELGDDILMGDIYISLDTVLREAATANISVADHIAHLVVHGMLHLQGYDHIQDDEAAKMENKEILILKKMGIKNPYEDVTAVCSDFCDCKNDTCPGAGIIKFFNKMHVKVDGLMQYLLMGFAGAISALGFAPFHMWWFSILGIGVAYWIMTRASRARFLQTFLRALPFSAIYSVAMFWWVMHSIYVLPELTAQFAIWTVPGLIGIAIAGGIIFAIPFVALSRVRCAAVARPFVFAGFWTVVLWAREFVFTGFPWNPIANIAMPCPFISNSMALWGAIGLTFVITGFIAACVELLRQRRRNAFFVLFIFIALLLGGAVFGGYNMHRAMSDVNASPVIRIVQPAQSAAQKATHSREQALQNAEYNVRNLMAIASADGAPDLIVFPETSYPFVIVDDDMPMSKILGTNIVLGATSFNDGKLYNSMAMANPNGQIDKIYSKSHLVPFGEYRPFGDIIPTPGQLTPGWGPEIITMNISGRDFRFAPAICYEIIFSDSLVPRNSGNIDAIINITNDTWFGKTPGTYQHLDMVRRYAIESGLPIIRANYSGVSAFITSAGSITSSIPVGVAGHMDGIVWGAHMTPYRAIGRDGWMIIILIIAIVGAVYFNRQNKE
ncbi:MAG: apolipoprotein N-acyltransferase [Alphaproteobacteria bacterium]|nr:apolipoprotein N-acyltransferase [Alphaproteobacteria bacterium]